MSEGERIQTDEGGGGKNLEPHTSRATPTQTVQPSGLFSFSLSDPSQGTPAVRQWLDDCATELSRTLTDQSETLLTYGTTVHPPEVFQCLSCSAPLIPSPTKPLWWPFSDPVEPL